MQKKIVVLEHSADLEEAFPIMQELRPHLTLATFKEIYDEAHANDGYRIAALKIQGQIMAIMGFRILSDFVRGRHIYIDDLVSTEQARSKGYGAELLQYAETIATASNLKVLRLCAVLENERGIQFYDKNGWNKRAYAYTKKVSTSAATRYSY